jgi:hypothetical protein
MLVHPTVENSRAINSRRRIALTGLPPFKDVKIELYRKYG